MSNCGLHAYIVPMEDAHQSEYIADVDKRLPFVSSFTGSRGYGVVTIKEAAMWTDGRYFLQARAEMPPEWTLMKEQVADTPTSAEWLARTLAVGDVVGVDANLISHAAFTDLAASLSKSKVTLRAHPANLVDKLWGEAQPKRPSNPVHPLGVKYSGETWQSKLDRIRSAMAAKKTQALLLCSLDEIAWTFNLRGSDIVYNPVFFSYAIIEMNRCTLFLSSQQAATVKTHLTDPKYPVRIEEYSNVQAVLSATVKSLVDENCESLVWVSGRATNHALAQLVPQANTYSEQSPVLLLKAVKNAVELEGFRQSHIKDGVAHVEFLYWLENKMLETTPNVTENSAADYIAARRAEQKDFVSLSFGTISAVGGHASSPHYHPDPAAHNLLRKDKVFLLDSGAQFLDGTTDVTRTMVFDNHTTNAFLRQMYTLVLKAHINLARQLFPSGTNGMRLDTLSRKDMWNVGLDFGHGTGHGVGHYLNVHEGPAGFGYRSMSYAKEGIVEGMVLTIEPGYYHAGDFGIRIENVYLVRPTDTQHSPAEGCTFLSFEPVTLVPIEKTLIDVRRLSFDEATWLNYYHAIVESKIGAELRRQGKIAIAEWLKQACAPVDVNLAAQVKGHS